FEGKRYDVGEKLGFIQTTIEFALQNEELRDDVLHFMKQVLERATEER
ncbi:MAG: UTP--glucose-1-phosphate uridylyltransferase, partial [Bacillaceae bacterium]